MSEEQRERASEAVAILNGIHELDPTVLPCLLDYRVPCNQALADHPTVQVGRNPQLVVGGYEVGLLGILNGLFGVKDDDWGYIAAKYDESGKLTKFILLD